MLSEKQQKVFEYLQKRLQEGVPPTVREICIATGIKSTSTVHAILNVLEEEGLISRKNQSAREIHLCGVEKSVQVPVLGKVTAGVPILAVEQIEGYVPFFGKYARDKELFALNVSGFSMKNAGILDGDIVICEQAASVNDGEIVVALIEDEATVKRLYREKFGVRLEPENEDFDPIYAAEVTVLGKVIASLRLY